AGEKGYEDYQRLREADKARYPIATTSLEIATPMAIGAAASRPTLAIDKFQQAFKPQVPTITKTAEKIEQLKIKNIQNTRGQGRQFHGARGPIQSLEEGYYNPENIYGGESTFYTTDAIDIAAGYQRKKPNSIIYETIEKEPVNFFNMEDRLSASKWMQMFPESGMNLPSDDFIKYGIESASEKYGNPNLREIMDEMRLESVNEGYSKDSLQEFFAIITERLEKMGFGGMQHVGGIKTNKPKHLVKIYFQPSKQIELKPASESFIQNVAQGDFQNQPVRPGTVGDAGFESGVKAPEFKMPNPPEGYKIAKTALRELESEKVPTSVKAEIAAQPDTVRKIYGVAAKRGELEDLPTIELEKIARESTDPIEVQGASALLYGRKVDENPANAAANFNEFVKLNSLFGLGLRNAQEYINTPAGYISIIRQQAESVGRKIPTQVEQRLTDLFTKSKQSKDALKVAINNYRNTLTDESAKLAEDAQKVAQRDAVELQRYSRNVMPKRFFTETAPQAIQLTLLTPLSLT
ncbi:MAG: hypothetical protein EBR82_73565, partial [Caulobacteraceae bacterium]|nr:hypothetical protein [Caulobacteraceae bacterium]